MKNSNLSICLVLDIQRDKIHRIWLRPAKQAGLFIKSFPKSAHSEIIERVNDWLEKYQRGDAPISDIPLAYPIERSFRKDVYDFLKQIPFGKTYSYSQVAKEIGSPKAVRAVGNICRANPFPLVLPCHRIVGITGNLTGFAFGLEMKQQLIEFERLLKKNS